VRALWVCEWMGVFVVGLVGQLCEVSQGQRDK